MPFLKYKPAKQWGKHNIRIFKEILKAKNKRNFSPLVLHPEVAASGIQIHDPKNPEFFRELEGKQVVSQPPLHLQKPTHESHPLYKNEKCILFEGKVAMTDGIDQACAIINAKPAQTFSSDFYESNLPGDFLPENFQDFVIDSIMHGERYDPTIERLPKRFDPIIFWVFYPPLFGIPAVQKCNTIMLNLYRKVVFLTAKHASKLLSDVRLDFDAPLSAFVPAQHNNFNVPFVLRQQPHIVLQGERPIRQLANNQAIQDSKKELIPNIYPLSPLIDLEEEHIYNDHSLMPRSSFSNLFPNTIFSSREQDQKYPWTQEQNAAHAILNCFGAGIAHGMGNFVSNKQFSTIPKEPIVSKAVQLINGKLDLVAVQINNLDLKAQSNDGIKNMVWVEKAAHLYTPKPFYENLTEVTDLNFETVKKLVSFLLYR